MDRMRQWPRLGSLLSALLLALSNPVLAVYDLDVNSSDSIKKVTKLMTEDMLSYYNGSLPGATPGLLPDPYYWWEAGAMMGALIDYWYYTKDDSYVNITVQGLIHQAGPTNDYMPRNQTLTEGNDDQGFWGLSVMSAAELNFPDGGENEPSWLGLAQAVFNTQAARWDTGNCNGGLRWQIFKWNNGFDYKNSISQACFFALGARLALFTGNQSYADWADKTWNWMNETKFIADNGYIYDGASIESDCKDISPYQFTYNAGGFILGAAAMYNYTEDQVWKDRLDLLLEGSKVFFAGPEKNIMEEVACESVGRCNLDQQSFKAYLSRWFAAITKWAPDTYDVVMPYLQASASAAAKQCTGGKNGRMCGMRWVTGKYDGKTGVGQQMAAMEVTLACMVKDGAPPVTAHTGGTSKSNPGGGSSDIGRTDPMGPDYGDISAGDTAGAAILTMLVLGGLIAGVGWMMLDETSDKPPLEQFKGFQTTATAAIATFAVTGGAAAAALRRKGDHKGYNEKGAAGTDSDISSRVSDENQAVTAPTPMAVGQVRNENVRHTRRMSNMPLGWPHNPSVRGSMMLNSEGGSMRDSPSDFGFDFGPGIQRHSNRNSSAASATDSASDIRPPPSMRHSFSVSVRGADREVQRPHSVREISSNTTGVSSSDVQRPRSMHYSSSGSVSRHGA